jgi:hypothetical protein
VDMGWPPHWEKVCHYLPGQLFNHTILQVVSTTIACHSCFSTPARSVVRVMSAEVVSQA